MANPVGNELVAVIGVSATGGPSAVTEYFTTSQIGGAGFLSTREITSGVSDAATSNDNLIAWDSSSASAKTQTIPVPTKKSKTLVIKDEYGNAGTYNITISPASGTIDGSATFVMNSNLQSVTLVANGTSNWMVV